MINLPIEKIRGLKLDNRKMLLIALICLVIFYMDFNYLIRMQFAGIRALSPKVARLKNDIKGLEKDLSRFRDMERRGSPGVDAADASLKQIVHEDRLLILLQEVSDLANKNGVRIMQISTSADAKAREETIAGERLMPVNINLNLLCDYHSFVKFADGLGSLRYFIDTEDIKIARNERDYLMQNVNLTLKTYARK